MKLDTRFITTAAIIGALYAALTLILAPVSYGPVQVRIAEALTVLPYFFPQAIPGLYLGCMAANIFGGYGPIDIFGGSFLTLIAAFLTYWLRRFNKPWLAPLPPVVINAFGVSLYLAWLADVPYWVTVGYIAVGQFAACYLLGLFLLYAIKNRFSNL
ncbi:QueT transporter family protein [candidate division KSB1 bacterium]|nr:QueT transporter family protein [candidate division KSB1 bacterium]